MNVKTKPNAAETARASARKEVAKAVEIPGFRKGKAPAHLVEQQYKSHIEKEFHDTLIRNALNEAIHLSNIRPFRKSTDIRITKFDPAEEGSFSIEIQFESFPTLPTIDLKAIQFNPEALKETTPEDIEKKIEELQLYHAEWLDIVDRGAEEEDYVILDVDILHDGHEHAVHRSNRFKLAKGKMPDWVRNLVKGLKAGESKTGMSEKEEGDSKEEFKPQEFRFTVNKVQKPVLPPLDEALSKKAGVDSVELLKEAIEKRVKKDHETEVKHKNRMAMIQTLCTSFPFELPASSIEQLKAESESIAEQEVDSCAPVEQKQKYAEELLKEAERTVRISYIVPKVFHDHHLAPPTGQEIQQRATEKMIARYMNNPNAEQIDPETLIRIAENELYHERAIDFLIDEVKKA